MSGDNPMGLPPEDYEELMKEYKDSIKSQIEEIATSINNLQNSKSKEDLEHVRLLVHKMAGSSGTYGFQEASDTCRSLEGDLVKLIEAFDASQLEEAFFEKLKTDLTLIEKQFR